MTEQICECGHDHKRDWIVHIFQKCQTKGCPCKKFQPEQKLDYKKLVEEDEKNCVPGSLAHDKKLAKEREDYLRSISNQGGAIHNAKV